jgi:hypothetical protein
MANNNQDLRFVRPIVTDKRATGVVSGFIDCGFGGANYGSVLIVADKNAFTNKSSKLVLTARHATASGVTFASATAFNTAAVASGATNSTTAAFAININRSGGTGRFIRVKLSSVTASTNAGVIGILSRGTAIPPETTGFSTVSFVPAAP